MKYIGVIERTETVTIDGYSNKVTAEAAIREMGRWIVKHIDKAEGEMIVEYGVESIHPASESYGGYFFEIEEVPCACQWNEETEEMEYSEGRWYIVCRIVK